MARVLAALLCLLLARALTPGLAAAQADTAARDTAAARPDTLRGRLPRLGDGRPLRLIEPPVFRAPWLGAPRRPPAVVAAAWDSATTAAVDSLREDRATALLRRGLYGVALARDTISEFEAPEPEGRGVFGLDRKFADLVIDGQARLDIRTDRLRNHRCTAAEFNDPNSGCRGRFKAPRLDNVFNIRSGGVLGRRIFINVDYDSEREFSASNNIQVFYQGLEDEIVRRVEVGTVSFRPPPSRFITSAIPSNNFGVNATFDFGPLQFQALAATQKGSVVAERTYAVGATTTQPQDRTLRDLDFETGRFFWVVDPTLLPAFPAIDVLTLPRGALPVDERPADVRVYRHRVSGQGGTNPNLGGINAVAVARDGVQRFGGAQAPWELLIQGADYYLDPSGLWIALNTKLDPDADYLAVSYTTESGGQVGTFPTVATPGFTDTLRLIVDPTQQPAQQTFRHEMRQIYRVAGEDLDAASLLVNLSLNRSERPLAGTPSTYLAALGVAVPTDEATFDRQNRLFPRAQDAAAPSVLHGAFLVFPHLQPFGDDARLTPAEQADTIYRAPLDLIRSPEGIPTKFSLRLRYNSTGSGDRTTLNLNALQIRDGSERLTLAGRALERGVDYEISYETGVVTFLQPDVLFGGGSATITARFEERELFAVAPTSVFGFSSTYSLGERGTVNFIALYQSEQSAFNRPSLGFEASANFIGGVNTRLEFRPNAITRFLDGLTPGRTAADSRFEIGGEFAFTKPDPNRSGVAYIEEFEADAGLQVGLRETNWEFGSRPERPDAIGDLFPAGFELDDATQLVWQNLVQVGETGVFEIVTREIDSLIQIAGRDQREQVLFLTMHADTAGGLIIPNDRESRSRWTLPARPNRPRWRSMVTALSTTGTDFTRNEYLEFYVYQSAVKSADAAGLRLVIDLGGVDEDAVAIAPESLAVGVDSVFSGRRFAGVGRLDTERQSLTGIFNAETDDNGILADRTDTLVIDNVPVEEVPLCQRVLSTRVSVFPWGDLGARCTRGNGTLDTEDLDGDRQLNGRGEGDDVFRYVIDLKNSPKYFVRNASQNPSTGEGWRLYRVPIRDPDAVIGSPNLRLIKQLRVTVAAPPDDGGPDVVGRFGVARMRFVGTPWARRAEQPIAGLAGATGVAEGDVIASVVSTESNVGYESPPGVVAGLQRRDNNREQGGTRINEKSLRVIANGIGPFERAEAYLRFPSGPQNLLRYRQLRVWMRGRGTDWDAGLFHAFVKVGSDAQNFYLFRAPAKSVSWEPEMVIELDVWRRLRAQLETRWLQGLPPDTTAARACGGEPDAFVACDGGYLVYLRDPGINPPNLAAAQEVAAGLIHTGGGGRVNTELWVDDIRLTAPISETGTAIALDARLAASDVADVGVLFTRQDGQFRQLGEDPSYRTVDLMQLSSNVRLDRFLPPSLGLAMPLSVTHARSRTDLQLISGTDLAGEGLAGLRRPSSTSTTYGLTIRRQVRGTSWLARGLIDPLVVTGALTTGDATAELSQSVSRTYALNAAYNLSLTRRGVGLGLGGLVDKLPGFLRNSDGGNALRQAAFTPYPTVVRLSSGLSRNRQDFTSYAVPIQRPSDAALLPTRSLQHLWRNAAGLTWQPLGLLTVSSDLASTRDLRVYPDSTPIGRLAYQARRSFLGVPVGVERDRTLSSSIIVAPRLVSWLRPRYSRVSGFVLSRSLNTRDPVRVDDEEGAFILPQTLNNQRSRELGLSLDWARGLQRLFGDSTTVARAVARLRPIDVSQRLTHTSTYDLAAFDPDLRFMLAEGSLEDLLRRGDDRAIGASRLWTTAVTGGADLPFGLVATLNYSLSRSERYQNLSGQFAQTITRQVEWPNGNVRWTRPFRSGPLSLLTLGTSFRRREGISTQPGQQGGATMSSTRSSTISPDLNVGFRNGVSVTLGYSTLDQEAVSNGNLRRQEQDDITGSVSYAFRLPLSVSRARKLVRSSLTFLSTKSESCLVQRGQTACATTSDLFRRELRGALDTDVARNLTGGLQFGYTLNDAGSLGRRTSQIFLSATMQVSLFAGDYR